MRRFLFLFALRQFPTVDLGVRTSVYSWFQRSGATEGGTPGTADQVEPEQAPSGAPERRTGHAGKSTALRPERALQAGQAFHSQAQRILPTHQELLPRYALHSLLLLFACFKFCQPSSGSETARRNPETLSKNYKDRALLLVTRRPTTMCRLYPSY